MRSLSLSRLSMAFSSLPTYPRVVTSGNFAVPFTVLHALDSELEMYTLNILNAGDGIPDRKGVTHETFFVGTGMRDSSRLHYIPCRLSLVPVLFSRVLRPDVVILHTSVPRKGAVSLGIEVNVLPAAIAAARAHGGVVIAQANHKMPYTYGDAELQVDEIDYLVEVDEPLPSTMNKQVNDVAHTIGDRIARHVPDGATLQLGIGAIPDAVLTALTKRRRLGVWSEMFSDGILMLQARGCLDNDRPITASFVLGSLELYEFIDENRNVRMQRTEVTNDPARIALQPAMTSVNSALEVDLSAQANASRINGRIYSGFGGSTDFMVGSLHSPSGHAFMALPSWHQRANTSTIVPQLKEPVTSFQHSAIVTERGLAKIFGHSETEQAVEIIDKAAHPDTRDSLYEAARKLGRIYA